MVSTVLTQQVGSINCKINNHQTQKLWAGGGFSHPFVEDPTPLHPIQHPFLLCDVYLFADLSNKKAQQHSSWKLLCTVGMMCILIVKPFCLSQFFSWNPVCVCSVEELAVEVLQSYKTTVLCRNIPSKEALYQKADTADKIFHRGQKWA